MQESTISNKELQTETFAAAYLHSVECCAAIDQIEQAKRDGTFRTKSLVPNTQPPQEPHEVLVEFSYIAAHRVEIGRIMEFEGVLERWRYAKAAHCDNVTIARAYREPWRLSTAKFVEIVRVHMDFHPHSQIVLLLKGRR